jgi:Tetratricopeptide repeat/WD domain, G-beta repeat
MTARPLGTLLLALAALPTAALAKEPPAFTLKGQLEAPEAIRQLAFSADGRFLLAGDAAAQVSVFEADGRKKVASFDTRHGELRALVVSPASGLLATTGKDGFVRLWDPVTGRLLREFQASGEPLEALAFDPAGAALASGGEDKIIRVHDPDTGLLQTELKGHDDTIRSLAFVDGGKSLLSCASDKTLRLWDLRLRRETRNQVERAAEYGDLNGFAVAARGNAFVTLTRELKRAQGGIRTIGGRGGAGVVETYALIVRALDSWAEESRLEGHLKAIHRAAFSPDGQWLASAAEDQAVLVWDREGKQKLLALDTGDKLWAVAFSFDGRWLAAGGDDKKVSLWFVKWPQPEKAAPLPQAQQPEKKAAAPEPVAAKDLYDQGRREFNLGHYDRALELFERAYKAQPDYRLLYNIGQCHRLLGDLEQARRVYRGFLNEAGKGDRNIAAVEEKIAEIDAALKAQKNVRESPPSGLAKDKDAAKEGAAPAPKK